MGLGRRSHPRPPNVRILIQAADEETFAELRAIAQGFTAETPQPRPEPAPAEEPAPVEAPAPEQAAPVREESAPVREERPLSPVDEDEEA